jgi:hypothetical protein
LQVFRFGALVLLDCLHPGVGEEVNGLQFGDSLVDYFKGNVKELLVEDLFAEDEAEKLVFLQQLSHIGNLPVVC